MSSHKGNEHSPETGTSSPGSSSESTSSNDNIREKKRRLSTTSDDDEQEVNGDLNGNDLVKDVPRLPKENEENKHKTKKIKLDEQSSKNRNEVQLKSLNHL